MHITTHSPLTFLFLCLAALFCAHQSRAEVVKPLIEVYSTPTGAGKVYLSDTLDTPADSSYQDSIKLLEKRSTWYLYAKPNEGQVFCGWSNKEDGDIFSTDSPYQANVDPNKDMKFYARFGALQVIAFLPTKGGTYSATVFGSVYHAGDTAITANALCLEAKADSGYKFYGWYTTTDGGRTKHYFSASDKVDNKLFTDSTTVGAEFVRAWMPLPSPTAISDNFLSPMMYVNQINNDAYYGARANWQSFRFSKTDGLVSDVIKQYSENATGYPYDDLRLGAFHMKNKKYYTITVHNDGQGNYPVCFCQLDVASGDTVAIRYFNSAEQSAWQMGDSLLVDMAYNPCDEKLYALGHKVVKDAVSDSNRVISALYIVSPDSGEVALVRDFDVIYNEFCFDLQGNSYFTSSKPSSEAENAPAGTLLEKRDTSLAKLSSKELMTDSIPCVQQTIGALAIDYKTGAMYWLSAKDYLSPYILRKVDAGSGQCEEIGTMPAFNCYSNLFIPSPAPETLKVPAMVQALDAKPNSVGVMEDTISWINPTLTWDGYPLDENSDPKTNLTAIKIYRKKAGVATSALTTASQLISETNADSLTTISEGLNAGQACHWIDTAPLAGINTYYVLAVNGEGEGVIDSISCFVGQDAIAGVDSLAARKDGENIALKWSAPARGIHNGFIPTNNLSYKIVRYPDTVVVAENYTDTAFVDTTLGQVERYYYAVLPYCGDIIGDTTLTNSLLAGDPIPAPCLLNFLSQSDVARWTFQDDNDRAEYVDTDENLEPVHALSISLEPQTSGELLSPPLLLTAKQTYRLTIELSAQTPDETFTLSTAIGTDCADNEANGAMNENNNATNEANGVANETEQGSIETNGANIISYEALRTDTTVSATDNRIEIADEFTPTQTGVYYYRLKIAPQAGNSGSYSTNIAPQVGNSGSYSTNVMPQAGNSGSYSTNTVPQVGNSAIYRIYSLSVDDITGIFSTTDDTLSSATATIVGYYSLSGVKQSGLRRGVNIVKYSNGTVKKILVK